MTSTSQYIVPYKRDFTTRVLEKFGQVYSVDEYNLYSYIQIPLADDGVTLDALVELALDLDAPVVSPVLEGMPHTCYFI